MKIGITPERAGLCAGEEMLHLMVEVECGEVQEAPKGRSNLALVIDRSGSMNGGKLEAAKQSIRELVARLGRGDAVGVIAYDDEVDITLGLSQAEVARTVLPPLLEQMETGGSTNLHGGWLAGAGMLAPSAGADSACHVVLLSDGQANQGVTSSRQICEQVANLCNAGITTTTIGFGRDFNEQLMTDMAKAGNGRALYGERIEDLADAFDEEISLLGNLVWRDVVLHIEGELRPRVLNGYTRHREGFRLPALARGGSGWAMLEIPMATAIRAAERGEDLRLQVTGVDGTGQRQTFELAWAWPEVVSREVWHSLPVDERLRRRLQELELARLQRDIRRAVMQGEWDRAHEMFDALRARAETDPWLAESLPFLEGLLREQDSLRMSKELAFRSDSLSTRMRAAHEVAYCALVEADAPAYLRRKTSEWRSRRG